MTYVVSILAVASYYCIMFILVMSIWLEPGRWENHITILECSWVRSVRKLYNYYRVLLWIMSLTYGHDRTSIASYFARGGIRCSFKPCWVWRQWTCICITFALFEVYWYWYFMLAWSEDKIIAFIMSITLFVCGGGLFIVYHVVYFFMKILLDMLHNVYFLCQCHWINKLFISYYFYLYIPLLLV
jgi:hypothetical protein